MTGEHEHVFEHDDDDVFVDVLDDVLALVLGRLISPLPGRLPPAFRNALYKWWEVPP